jgi:surface protein
MFLDAKTFNQPLNSWDVSSVTTMEEMFLFADAMETSNRPVCFSALCGLFLSWYYF